MSPFSAVSCRRTTTQSPSQIAASTIESPVTRSMNSSPSPVRRRGIAMTSSTCCSARTGPPAAMRPTQGTGTLSASSVPVCHAAIVETCDDGAAAGEAASPSGVPSTSSSTSRARGRPGSRRM